MPRSESNYRAVQDAARQAEHIFDGEGYSWVGVGVPDRYKIQETLENLVGSLVINRSSGISTGRLYVNRCDGDGMGDRIEMYFHLGTIELGGI